MSSLSTMDLLISFDERLSRDLLESFLLKREEVTEMIPEGVKEYVATYLEEGDIEACLCILKEDMSRVLTLPGPAVKIARKAIPELLALMRNKDSSLIPHLAHFVHANLSSTSFKIIVK